MPDLVTAMMVTQPGREALAAESIDDFCRQTWPDRELVVVTDGDEDHQAALEAIIDAAAARSCPGASFNLVCVSPGKTLGDLRNAALRQATGKYLIQWDDDDRYCDARMAAQVEPLRWTNCACSCYTAQLYFAVESRQLHYVNWYRRRPRFNSVLIPGTIAVRADVAGQVRYPPLSRGEDGKFLERALAFGTAAELPGGFQYLRRFHGVNTSGRAHFSSNARWLGAGRDEMLEMRDTLVAVFNSQPYATPGTIHVMAREGLAYQIEVTDGHAQPAR